MRDRGRSHSKVPGRCRACSTAERTATNIVQAPIARAHRTPRAPLLLLLCSCSSCSSAPAPVLLLLVLLVLLRSCSSRSCPLCSCSLCSCSLLLLPLLPARAARSRACAPFARSSLFRLWRCSRTFPSPCVHTISYLGFASQRLA